mmetsp:Transcript_13323/g.32559  ORF Transcript_13323/g.32559 Transcript_13323/m.32559 type:complete len:220 (-) Transcript_13323:260-919(-)
MDWTALEAAADATAGDPTLLLLLLFATGAPLGFAERAGAPGMPYPMKLSGSFESPTPGPGTPAAGPPIAIDRRRRVRSIMAASRTAVVESKLPRRPVPAPPPPPPKSPKASSPNPDDRRPNNASPIMSSPRLPLRSADEKFPAPSIDGLGVPPPPAAARPLAEDDGPSDMLFLLMLLLECFVFYQHGTDTNTNTERLTVFDCFWFCRQAGRQGQNIGYG